MEKPMYGDYTASELVDMEEYLNFDIEIQRQKVWDDKKKGLFIDSLIQGYVYPPIYGLEMNGQTYILDGKQRITTVIDFLNNRFILPGDMDKVEGINLSGMSFSGLEKMHPKFADKVRNARFDIYKFVRIKEEEIEETFRRLNMGERLSNQELRRVRGGFAVIRKFNEITSHKFFAEQVNIAKRQLERKADEEIVTNILLLISQDKEEFKGLSKTEQDAYWEGLREFGLNETDKNRLIEILDYMSTVASMMTDEMRKRIFKRSHTPLIAKIIHEIALGKIEERDFETWLNDFYETTPVEYDTAGKSSTTAKNSVLTRLNIMEERFNKFLADDFRPRVIKESSIG